MAKSAFTRKARAYGRRKFNSRRRARAGEEAARQAAAQKKREADKLQNILGIVSAVGYNENVLPLAASLSKRSRSNYLTSTLLKKKVEHAKAQAAKRYNYNLKLNALQQAVVNMNAEGVKEYFLKTKKQNLRLEDEDHTGKTPLEVVFQRITKQNETAAREIVKLLLEKGAKIRRKTMFMLWDIDYENLYYFLQTFPAFRHRTLVYKDQILDELKYRLQIVQTDINEAKLDFNRNYGGYGRVPGYLLEEYDRQEERIYAFREFLMSYDETSGYFTLFPEENNFENIYRNLNNANNNNNNNNNE